MPFMSGHRRDGLAYELRLPQGEPRGGVVVLHGAGSCTANDRDFALCDGARQPAHGGAGGDHHSAQDDPALQAGAVDFLVGLT